MAFIGSKGHAKLSVLAWCMACVLVCVCVFTYVWIGSTDGTHYALEEWTRIDASRASRPIVLLTTTPDRLNSDQFRNILQGRILPGKPSRIFLALPWVFKRLNQTYDIPVWVKSEPLIFTIRCEDVGPLTRMVCPIPFLNDTQDPVVIMDDDVFYRVSAVNDSLACYQRYPDDICAFASGFLRVDRDGVHYRTIRSFASWVTSQRTLRKLAVVPQVRECFLVDDEWIGHSFHQLGIPVHYIKYAEEPLTYLRTGMAPASDPGGMRHTYTYECLHALGADGLTYKHRKQKWVRLVTLGLCSPNPYMYCWEGPANRTCWVVAVAAAALTLSVTLHIAGVWRHGCLRRGGSAKST